MVPKAADIAHACVQVRSASSDNNELRSALFAISSLPRAYLLLRRGALRLMRLPDGPAGSIHHMV